MTTQMPLAPRIVQRAEQPYAAIGGTVTMQTIGAFAAHLPEVYAWLGAHGLEPAGAPFFRYNVIDMERQLEIEAGVPATGITEGGAGILVDVLPAGRYATLTHVGQPDELMDATSALLDWASAQGLKWDMSQTGAAEKWGCRLEIYQTNRSEEPDMANWETELAFRLAD